MSEKIKKVTMNGVELFLRDGKWSTISGRLVIYDTALEPTLKDGLITVEYEPEMVRCDHWGSPRCSSHCTCYEEHEHTAVVCDGGCEAHYAQKCIPDAPGWAATHPKPTCEHGEDPATCWKCAMLLAWRDGELELWTTRGGWTPWEKCNRNNSKPEFTFRPSEYRRRPKTAIWDR